MHSITPFVRRHALVLFFGLAYALSWSLSLLNPHELLPIGPLIAALLVLPFSNGRAGVRDFLSRIVRWRVGLGWYLLVLGLPVALTGAALGANILLGAPAPMWGHVPPLAELPATALFILIAIGLGEEPAWRGFALPRLAAGRSVLAGSLLLFVLHALWHLPLFGLEYDLQNGVPWLLMLLGGTIFSTWVYYRTNGNLLLPILFHTSVNVSAKYLFLALFSGADMLRGWWLLGGLWFLTGCALLLIAGRELGRSPALQADATVVQPLAA